MTPRTTNWTAEAIFRSSEGDGQIQFIHWGRGLGHTTNGPSIAFGYSEYSQSFFCNLMDAEETNTLQSTYIPLGEFIPNGRWHHVALIKSNTTMFLYLDYQLATNVDLLSIWEGDVADGTYPFDTATRASIGESLNGGNETDINTFIDEVRFSARNLELHEFLQPGQPMLVDLRNSALLDPGELTVKVILDETYRVETSPSLGPTANWQKEGLSFVGANTFQFVDVSTVPQTNLVRIIRED